MVPFMRSPLTRMWSVQTINFNPIAKITRSCSEDTQEVEMRSLSSAAALLLGALILFPIFGLKGGRAATQTSAPTVVHMNKTPLGTAYSVNPKPKGFETRDNLLRILDLVYDERGPHAPVVVLVDPRVPFTEIWNFDGVADKAQLTNIHYFVFNPETKYMAELKWGPTVPYSTNPPLN
jgi:hypothetical protein